MGNVFNKLFGEIGGGLNFLIWSGRCRVCKEGFVERGERICGNCWESLGGHCGGDYCPGCGKSISRYGIVGGRCANCVGQETYLEGVGRVGEYGGVLRDILIHFKLRDRLDFIGILGPLVRAAFEGCDFNSDIDVITFVPLHWRRRLWRGFNQSKLLAEKLSCGDLKVSSDLVRVRHTRPQRILDTAAGRKRNVQGAFAVREGHCFSGKRVLLVDDIKTSGATLEECSRTLKDSGALKVYAFAVGVVNSGK